MEGIPTIDTPSSSARSLTPRPPQLPSRPPSPSEVLPSQSQYTQDNGQGSTTVVLNSAVKKSKGKRAGASNYSERDIQKVLDIVDKEEPIGN